MDSPTLQVGVKMLAIYKGKFLIARRSDKVYSGVKGTMWDIPGGRIDPTFSLYENLKREIVEEVGLELSEESWENTTLLDAQDIWVTAKNLHVIRLTYIGMVEGEIALSHEHDEYKLASCKEMLEHFDEDNLIGKVLRANKQIIENFLHQ
jgi:8-oxo-dGTP pyrophosphatase MutT (NUDIX family)